MLAILSKMSTIDKLNRHSNILSKTSVGPIRALENDGHCIVHIGIIG